MNKLVETSIQYLKGIGPKKAKSFNKSGINTIEDLLYYFPRRYEDRTNFISISQLKEGQNQTIKAQVLARGERQSFRRRGFSIIEVAVGDDTGKIFCVWFNQPYLKEYFKVGTTLILYGRVERYEKRLQMNSPEFEIVQEAESSLDLGRLVPIYALPQGLTQRNFRHLVKYTLDEYLPEISDCLPYDIRARNNLLNLAQSLINIHFPENLELQKQAYERLAFEEFFLFQIPLVLRKLKKKEGKGIAHKIEGELLSSFIKSLPFELTPDQQKVIEEIQLDMAGSGAMQRLLQGDVGSGKTIVATIASIIAITGGYQVAFMVPTEILAKQHYINIKNLRHKEWRIRQDFWRKISPPQNPPQDMADSPIFVASVADSPRSLAKKIKYKEKEINVCLLTSSSPKKEKEKIYQEIREGKTNLILGTHALLEEGVQFKNLGLVVIDEQHKFGVGQRALLPQKGYNPDVLIMTATPIPRTLAITIYGDLDISVIRHLPPGRQPIKTLLLREKERPKAYEIAKKELRQGRQAYIIYPVIEESYALDIAGAKKMYLQLKSGEFKEFNLGLIHGRLKQAEQDKIMLKFKNRELDILVSTTVLEVGIDMPNATCMIIEHAERFGLSQLHQLRGRVGRGGQESVCILLSEAETEQAKARLQAMVMYGDGFRIAEEDLKIRGPGEFFGRRQSGLTELKIANPLTQMQLLKLAREEAIKLVACDQGLGLRQNQLLRGKLLQRFPEYEKLMLVG